MRAAAKLVIADTRRDPDQFERVVDDLITAGEDVDRLDRQHRHRSGGDQVTQFHRDVLRLGARRQRVEDVERLGQPDKILEPGERSWSPAIDEIGHVRRTADRDEGDRSAADVEVVVRIAGCDGASARRCCERCGDEFLRHPHDVRIVTITDGSAGRREDVAGFRQQYPDAVLSDEPHGTAVNVLDEVLRQHAQRFEGVDDVAEMVGRPRRPGIADGPSRSLRAPTFGILPLAFACQTAQPCDRNPSGTVPYSC